MTRAEWMNGICLIWSRGRFNSPSLPVGDDRYLNLSSQKRPTGRNLGGNRSVRRSGTTSRGTVVLVFCLRMRRFALTLVLTLFLPYSWEWNEFRSVKWIHDSVYVIYSCQLPQHAGGSVIQLLDQNFVAKMWPFCLTIAFAKCPKMTILRHFLKFCFIKIFGFKTNFFFLHCSNKR